MHLLRAATPLALVGALALSAPAIAAPDHGGRGGDRAAQLDRGVPSRVASSIKRADKALDRAAERIDDGQAASAASALNSAQSNLATALRSAKRTVAANGAKGPASAAAVAQAEHRTIAEVVNLLGGVSDDATVTELAELLAAQTAGRDELVAAIAGLSDRSAYERVLALIAEQLEDETAAIDEALLDEEDDTLTQAAKDALTAAKAAVAATATTVAGLGGAGGGADYAGTGSSTDYAPAGAPAGSREDCPPRGRAGTGTGAGADYGTDAAAQTVGYDGGRGGRIRG